MEAFGRLLDVMDDLRENVRGTGNRPTSRPVPTPLKKLTNFAMPL